jgi:hypothetical protein
MKEFNPMAVRNFSAEAGNERFLNHLLDITSLNMSFKTPCDDSFTVWISKQNESAGLR